MKTIIRVKRQQGGFTIIPNEILRKKMSLRAKGLLCMILSNMDEWVVTKAWAAEHCTEGRDSIKAAFDELLELGYASVEEQGQMVDGRFSSRIWTFTDSPTVDGKHTLNASSGVENRIRETVNGNPPSHNTIEEDHRELSGGAAKERPRNELADHLAKACGSDVARMTEGEWKRVGVALAGIKKVEPSLTKEMIDAHVAGYRRIFRDAILTPLALMNNWGATTPMARPDAKSAVSTPDELKNLVERLSGHVANPRHEAMFGDLVTEAQKQEFAAMKERYFQLKAQLGGGSK
jgi:hypothetical protein